MKNLREAIKKYHILEAAVFAAIILLDQITKVIAKNRLGEGKRVPIIGSLLEFVFVENTGASFGWLEGKSGLFFVVTLFGIGFFMVLYYLFRNKNILMRLSVSMMAGGAIGNAIDRAVRGSGFFNGAVRDFISLKNFAIFNVADMALTGGVTLFAIMFIFFDKETKTENAAPEIKENDRENI